MKTKYTRLRDALSNLAAPAAEQVAYLDHLFRDLTGGESAEVYGNDELSLQLEDVLVVKHIMIEDGELSQTEASEVDKVEQLLDSLSDEKHVTFWYRNALYEDPRWEEVRKLARRVLDTLPDEQRGTV